MIEEAEVNTMLNSLWNVLIHHTEVQDAHVTAHESLGMVCLFTKPEKNSVTNWESLWRSHCILTTTVTNSEFLSTHTINKFYGYGEKKTEINLHIS